MGLEMFRTLRGIYRLVVLILTLIQAMIGMWLFTRRNGGRLTRRQRAEESQRVCAMILRRMPVDVEIYGTPPSQGLLVSNHLSFLDVVLYGAACPCVFISKAEVLHWPIFGTAARMAGTVFVDRSRTAVGSAATANVEVALKEDVCVLLFPEGTSTNGSELRPFHSSFYEPAVRARAEVIAAAVGYPDAPDHVEEDVCYAGADMFFPRLMKALSLDRIGARLDFSPLHLVYGGRKEAMNATREEILAMRRLPREGSVVVEDGSEESDTTATATV
jgi:1-acyl-sn-glycerol-3-phosphate acyltransferase